MPKFMYQVPFPPSVNHIYQRTKKGVFLTKQATDYRLEVMATIGRGHLTLNYPLSVSVDLYPPDKRKRDIDNTMKALLDALTHAGVWKDDSQIVQLIINRRDIESPGRALVTVGAA